MRRRRPPRVLELRGAPDDLGRQHGGPHGDAIRSYFEERLSLVQARVGSSPPRGELVGLAEDCLPAHREYAPDLYEEVLALSAASGLSPSELIIVGGFTDYLDVVRARYGRAPFEDTCTAFIVSDTAAGGQGFYGQTWDMHHTAEQHVVVLQLEPADSPAALVFSTVGCVGQIGLNEAGVAIGINDLEAVDGRPGVTWPFVVRKALQQSTVDDALECILDAPLAGAHNYLLFDRSGQGYNVEAMPSERHVTRLEEDEVLVHTNHCLAQAAMAYEAAKPADLMASSETRLSRGRELLKARPITIETLMQLTRESDVICRLPVPPWNTATCGAAIMQPQTGSFWAVWGSPDRYEYEHYSL